MRTILSVVVCLIYCLTAAQSQINKSFPIKANEQVVMKFDYPEIIRVSTWDGNEIRITGTVNINNNEANEAFDIKESKKANSLVIEGRIADISKIPRRITMQNGNEKMIFRSEAEYEQYTEAHNLKTYSVNKGSDIEIKLEIKIPKSIQAKIESTYGMVEIKKYDSNIDVNAIYGGIDATIVEKKIGKISAETNFGQIYTDLDTKFGGKDLDDFRTLITANPGNGPQYSLQSKYGNIYLRK